MRQSLWLRVGLVTFAFALFHSNTALAADADSALPVIVEEDFEGGMDRWQTTDPDPADSVWEVVEAATESGQEATTRFVSKESASTSRPIAARTASPG